MAFLMYVAKGETYHPALCLHVYDLANLYYYKRRICVFVRLFVCMFEQL